MRTKSITEGHITTMNRQKMTKRDTRWQEMQNIQGSKMLLFMVSQTAAFY